jgi:hypothetical protein
MSIFEKTPSENRIMVSKKILAAWIVAVDNEINTLDLEIYNLMFPENKDLKAVVKRLNISGSDIPEACSYLSVYYKDKPDEALLFLRFLINLSFTGYNVYPYEKIILDCLRRVIGLDEIVLSHEFEQLTKLSFFPVGNVSDKDWWDNPSSEYSHDFKNYYSSLKLETDCTSKEVRLKLQLRNVSFSDKDVDNIEHVLLNPKRKETYNKYLLYSDVIDNIYSYNNIVKKSDPSFLMKKNTHVNTKLLLAAAIALSLLSLANFKYNFIRVGFPEKQTIEIVNKTDSIEPTKEIVIISKVIKYVNTGELNLRTGPGLEFEILRRISEGHTVEVHKEIGGWSKVVYSATEKGWMATRHLATLD